MPEIKLEDTLKDKEKNQPNNSDSGKKGNDEQEFDPVAAINAMKENTVPKEKFDKLQDDYKKLFKAYANGERDASHPPAAPVDLKKLRKETFFGELNNLDYIKNILKIREETIARGGDDPFVPRGSKVVATDEDYIAAQRVADGLQACIDYADGDSEVFTNELQRITVDTSPYKGMNNRRR